ncbi:MAG: class II aldolase/adducin family protein [Dehalococcoidia bacterium]
MGQWDTHKRLLWETAQEMARRGLVTGTSGNASLRLPSGAQGELLAITPTQRPYSQLAPEEMVVLDLEGEQVEGELAPSSETALHLAIYRARRDVGAVLHTHSVFASVLAVTGTELPPIVDEMVVLVGGPVKVAQYAFPGTEELAQRALEALEERNAVLLRNHGLAGVGRSLQEALEVCHLVERVAQTYVYSTLLGRVSPLPAEMVAVEQELFRMRRRVDQEQERG